MNASSHLEVLRNARNIIIQCRNRLTASSHSPTPIPQANVVDVAGNIKPFEIRPTPAFEAVLLQSKDFPDVAHTADKYLSTYNRQLNRHFQTIVAKLQAFNIPGIRSFSDRVEIIRGNLQLRYENAIEPKLIELLQTLSEKQTDLDCQGRYQRPRFNQKYLSLLEDRFKKNPYPTKKEQMALAKETHMLPKQIETWFQNHRNRARKEGMALCKSDHQPPSTTLSQRSSPNPPSPTHRQQDTLACSTPDSEENHTVEEYESEALPHSTVEHYCPAPNLTRPSYTRAGTLSLWTSNLDSRPTFSPPEWPRRRRPDAFVDEKESITVDQLTTLFSTKLTLKDRRKRNSPSPASTASRLPDVPPRLSSLRQLPIIKPSNQLARPHSMCPSQTTENGCHRTQLTPPTKSTCFTPYARELTGNLFSLINARKIMGKSELKRHVTIVPHSQPIGRQIPSAIPPGPKCRSRPRPVRRATPILHTLA